MLEPDVVLTDYALAVETGLFAWLLLTQKRKITPLRMSAAFVFLALAASSALGGTYHGFFPAKTTTDGGWMLWIATLLTLGIAAVFLWVIDLLFNGKRITPTAKRVLAVMYAVYAVVVMTVTHRFWVGILFYSAPLLVLLGTCIRRSLRRPELEEGLAIVALVLMIGAALLQQWQWGLPALHLTFNALYHIVLGVALAMFYVALRRVRAK